MASTSTVNNSGGTNSNQRIPNLSFVLPVGNKEWRFLVCRCCTIHLPQIADMIRARGGICVTEDPDFVVAPSHHSAISLMSAQSKSLQRMKDRRKEKNQSVSPVVRRSRQLNAYLEEKSSRKEPEESKEAITAEKALQLDQSMRLLPTDELIVLSASRKATPIISLSDILFLPPLQKLPRPYAPFKFLS